MDPNHPNQPQISPIWGGKVRQKAHLEKETQNIWAGELDQIPQIYQ